MMRPALLMHGLQAVPAACVRLVGCALAAGVLLAALGPFGNYLNGGFMERGGYWCAAMLLGLVLYGSAFRTVAARASISSSWWWPAVFGATVAASIPQALVTRFWAFRLWPELGRLDLPFGLWFAQTMLIGLPAMVAFAVLHRRTARVAPEVLAPPPVRRSLPVLGCDVLALQMEDHYVRVHRASGSELLLLPLGQAIERVEASGLRTHRSWWVAAHAVARVEGDARAMRLHLTNGVVAPVARSAVAHLRAAGWLGCKHGQGGTGV